MSSFYEIDGCSGLCLCTDQIEARNASADEVKTCDVVGSDVFGGCRKCESAFHVSLLLGVFSSDLHDKGQAAPHPRTGQQTWVCRPVDFPRFFRFYFTKY